MTIISPKRVAIYCRVSTDEQAQHGFSLEDQELKGRAQAVVKSWEVAGAPYVDDGISGTTPAEQRPALCRLLADAKAKRIDVVCFTKLDRLARNLKMLLHIWDQIESYGCAIVVTDESIDTSTPVGRLVRNVLGSIAEFERDTILARTMMGHERKAQRGEAYHTTRGYGYIYTPGNRKTKTPGTLERDPETAPIVRRIFERVAGGMSASAVAVELTADGISTLRGRPTWGHATIRQIIRNPIYKGEATYGRRTSLKDAQTGKKYTRFATDASRIITMKVPAIVDADMWQRANEQLSCNRLQSKRNSRHEYLLGGRMLHCGVQHADGHICGHAMYGHAWGRGGRQYMCRFLHPTSKIGHHAVSATAVERAVWEALRTLMLDPSHVLADLEALSAENSAAALALEVDIVAHQHAYDDVTAKLARLLDDSLLETFGAEVIKAKAATLREQQQTIHEALAQRQAQRTAALANMLPIDDVKAACALLARGIDRLTFDERQFIVRRLCARITATKQEVVIDGWLPTLSTTYPLSSDDVPDNEIAGLAVAR